jgi:hypothetical protein
MAANVVAGMAYAAQLEREARQKRWTDAHVAYSRERAALMAALQAATNVARRCLTLKPLDVLREWERNPETWQGVHSMVNAQFRKISVREPT